jgi:transaldolase
MVKASKFQIFLDGANKDDIIKYLKNPIISGFTTNPSLMKKAGIKNYKKFSLELCELINKTNKSVSFEVFADELNEMYDQAKVISQWSKNIYVKIPVVNTKGKSTSRVIKRLTLEGTKLNITAVFTVKQCKKIIDSLENNVPAIISIFCGRIADSGVDPKMTILKCKELILKSKKKNIKILWASTREALNIIQAKTYGCDIITITEDILKKYKNFGKNLNDFSIETVKMFYNDAKTSNFDLG